MSLEKVCPVPPPWWMRIHAFIKRDLSRKANKRERERERVEMLSKWTVVLVSVNLLPLMFYIPFNLNREGLHTLQILFSFIIFRLKFLNASALINIAIFTYVFLLFMVIKVTPKGSVYSLKSV